MSKLERREIKRSGRLLAIGLKQMKNIAEKQRRRQGTREQILTELEMDELKDLILLYEEKIEYLQFNHML